MEKRSREALDAYYSEADSWAKDRNDALRASRRTAWIVAGVAAAVAVLEALALMFLTPLKTVQPYTLLVDRTTGYVQALNPLDPQRISDDAALTQSFLVQYVIAREGFEIDALETNYRRVGLWSADQARGDYVSAMQASNPNSPINLYPRTTVIDVRVKSVSPVGDHAAMVRFDTIRRDAGGHVSPPSAWVAVIRYRYTGAPARLEDRFVNPLGFEVVRYHRDAEALPAPEPQAVTATVPVPTAVVPVAPSAVIPSVPGGPVMVAPPRIAPPAPRPVIQLER